ncbi:MAG: hypothetical protein SFW07_06215 [Gammaproteobacteria bacterium]|nr:hypothetical protein [Gammaproteobacteria bacterium]
MKRSLLGICVVLLGVLSFSACAQDATPPKETLLSKCLPEGFAFQDNQIIFNSDKFASRVFLIHNISNGKVMINHIKANPGASAGWASALDKGNWSALMMGQANFSMGCMIYSPPKFGLIDCKKVISVCAMPSTLSSSGWLAENGTLEKITETAKSRGIDM